MPRILIVDDERPLREALTRFVRSLGWEADAASSGDEAMFRIEEADLILSDVRMPGLDGMSLLVEVHRRRPGLPVILLTGHGNVGLAVEAMRNGASNFLTKPIELDELEVALRAALRGKLVDRREAGRDTAREGTARTEERPRIDPKKDSREREAHRDGSRAGVDLLGNSPPMAALRELVRRVAQSDANVLITGPSGAGKEVVAHTIHRESRRNKGPFVAVNCGAIPETLIESELFGHTRGAFTGATASRVGRFGAAEGGTILLDEIGELPLHVQVKLLRVLQERAYVPVGSSEPNAANVRVLAATNRDLEAMVATGRFREDLYYRLNVLPVTVPPLRERGDDILDLANTFLERAATAEGRGKLTFDDDVARCLRRYPWPGNVRELEHAITRAAVLAPGEVLTLVDLPIKIRAAFAGPEPMVPDSVPPGFADLRDANGHATKNGHGALNGHASSARLVAVPTTGPSGPSLPEAGIDLNETLATIERRLIEEALARTGGNKNRAAALLRIGRTTLVEKLKRMHMRQAS